MDHKSKVPESEIKPSLTNQNISWYNLSDLTSLEAWESRVFNLLLEHPEETAKHIIEVLQATKAHLDETHKVFNNEASYSF